MILRNARIATALAFILECQNHFIMIWREECSGKENGHHTQRTRRRSTVLDDLKHLRFSESLDNIKQMSENMFRNILNRRIKENALKYLTERQKSKGKPIQYLKIQMAEYLLPKTSKLTISQKQKLFSARNRMIEISENFPNKQIEDKCPCGQPETIIHIYNCETLNTDESITPEYEQIYNGKIEDQIRIFEKLETNLNHREQLKQKEIENTPCDPSVIRYLYSNG